MPSVFQIEQDLVGHLLANLPVGFTDDMVKQPNAPFPETPNHNWLRATMTTPVIIDVDASNCYKEYNGLFVVDVFYKKGTGSIAALTTAQAIMATFNKVSFAYSFSLNADIELIGEEENWFHVQVVSTYQYGTYTAEA